MQGYPEFPVLIVDDEASVLDSYELTLLAQGIDHVVTMDDPRAALDWLAHHEASALVLDLYMPGLSGVEMLERVAADEPHLPVIVCTAADDLEVVVRCMRMGADDYLVKPVEPSRLHAAVRNAAERSDLRRENETLRTTLLQGGVQHPEAFQAIVTGHPRMQAVFQYIEAVAPTGRPVLIVGETGVGKELVARAIHRLSARRGPFVPVNIAGFDDTLLGDTLFGHVRGAYTGADRARPGLVEQAAGGTLFLDEIGDLEQASQVKLLRLLQEHEYLPLGADQPRRSDARIVVATHRNLAGMVAEGDFRKDLFYRLNAHKVEVLPLRERLEDLPLLVEHFLGEASAELDKPTPQVPPQLYAMLRQLRFPGNVRELQGLVYDAVARHQRGTLSLARFREHLQEAGAVAPTEAAGAEPPAGGDPAAPLPTLSQAEASLIHQALERAQGNQTLAARLLGISRPALIRRMQKLELGPHSGATPR